MGPGDLRDVLESLRDHAHPDLLVGLGKSDDAAVYRVSDEVAVVSTVDFFAPIVDDPYLFGAIAAANAMSDVYAMGGEVLYALNLAGFPPDMPKAGHGPIFYAGADKGRWSGGMKRNRVYVEGTLGARGRLSLARGISSAQAGLLFESETSGGLLFGVAREDVNLVLDGFARRGEPCWEIGEVAGEIGIAVR